MLAKLLIIPIVLAIGFLGWQVVAKQTTSQPTSSYSSPTPVAATQTFIASPVMNSFTVQIPQGFTAEEKFGTLFIKKNQSEILITFRGTNYSSLNELFTMDSELKNRPVTYISVNGLDTAYETKTNEKAYYIYKNNSIYSLFTTQPILYSDLDKISQSFTLPK